MKVGSETVSLEAYWVFSYFNTENAGAPGMTPYFRRFPSLQRARQMWRKTMNLLYRPCPRKRNSEELRPLLHAGKGSNRAVNGVVGPRSYIPSFVPGTLKVTPRSSLALTVA